MVKRLDLRVFIDSALKAQRKQILNQSRKKLQLTNFDEIGTINKAFRYVCITKHWAFVNYF